MTPLVKTPLATTSVTMPESKQVIGWWTGRAKKQVQQLKKKNDTKKREKEEDGWERWRESEG